MFAELMFSWSSWLCLNGREKEEKREFFVRFYKSTTLFVSNENRQRRWTSASATDKLLISLERSQTQTYVQSIGFDALVQLLIEDEKGKNIFKALHCDPDLAWLLSLISSMQTNRNSHLHNPLWVWFFLSFDEQTVAPDLLSLPMNLRRKPDTYTNSPAQASRLFRTKKTKLRNRTESDHVLRALSSEISSPKSRCHTNRDCKNINKSIRCRENSGTSVRIDLEFKNCGAFECAFEGALERDQ